MHLDHRCNYRCDFCYFTREGHLASIAPSQDPVLTREEFFRLQRLLSEAGVERLTYAGGEPTVSPFLEELILDWHRLQGGTRPMAMIVTNGTGLREPFVRRIQHALAAIKLSAESMSNAVEASLGRGYGDHIALVTSRAEMLHRLGVPIHLNSVICRSNWQEDLTPLVRQINPTVWKVFQFLPVPGQNDAKVTELSITARQFEEFLARHSHLCERIAAEDNELMRGSYAMIDPLGRFFQSTPEGYLRSRHSILEVGVEAAFAEVELNWGKYDRRGGDLRAFGG